MFMDQMRFHHNGNENVMSLLYTKRESMLKLFIEWIAYSKLNYTAEMKKEKKESKRNHQQQAHTEIFIELLNSMFLIINNAIFKY